MAEPVMLFPLVAVAVDKEKSSQGAFKWALDNVVAKGQTIILVHVVAKLLPGGQEGTAAAGKETLFPFRCFCRRKDVNCMDIVLADTDVPKAIVDFVEQSAIEKLVVGSSRGGFVRSFRSVDTSTQISKSVPDFCTVYIIHKGRTSSVKNATRPAPAISPLRSKILNQATRAPSPADNKDLHAKKDDGSRHLHKDNDLIRSPFSRGTYSQSTRPITDTMSSSDISFVSNDRQSTDQGFSLRMSYGSDGPGYSFESASPHRSSVYSAGTGCSSVSHESSESDAAEFVEAEMNRLRLELKQTMVMYNAACKEALTAKQKAIELYRWKMEQQQRVEEARTAEESALALVLNEKAKYPAAYEAGEAAKRIGKMEAQKSAEAEKRALEVSDEKRMTNFDSFPEADLRLNYRKYTIEEIEQATDYFAASRKIGEGGYGSVFKCYLDHTPVAIKVLRPDAAQGKSQFQQEVHILCRIRHPNMVCLLGACPEYGCLAYEYMANGSLEDRLFMRDNTPPIPWQDRFRIAAEIGTCLLFLHQTKPEPLVHRDLKPANILLDQNYTSKISDVGLARLVPPKVADQVTQYRMTSAAGTFCYIDPEYQQTGLLGTKSDVYSFGVLLLQLLTGKPPMGLTHLVECAIEEGTFAEVLDPTVQDWPVEEALIVAKIAIQCTELRRRDRPDLGKVIMPELNRLRDLSEINMNQVVFGNNLHTSPSPAHSQVSVHDTRSGPLHQQSGYESSSEYSGSSSYGK